MSVGVVIITNFISFLVNYHLHDVFILFQVIAGLQVILPVIVSSPSHAT